MRSGDPQTKCHFTSGIVGDRPWIVVMRPYGCVVAKLSNFEDFVLGLDVAVFGNPQINANTVLRDAWPVESGVVHGFIRTVNSDRSSSRTSSNFLAFLMLQRVEMADTGQHGRHISSFKFGNS